jgi:hypothetical protein
MAGERHATPPILERVKTSINRSWMPFTSLLAQKAQSQSCRLHQRTKKWPHSRPGLIQNKRVANATMLYAEDSPHACPSRRSPAAAHGLGNRRQDAEHSRNFIELSFHPE